MIPDEPLGSKPVSSLEYGDIVTPQGDHVMQTNIFYLHGRLSAVYVSNGEIIRRVHYDELPFFGNIMETSLP